jgi:hypothetical protein
MKISIKGEGKDMNQKEIKEHQSSVIITRNHPA